MQRKKGFTLIELLVVIAIIGILSSVVLAALNTARNKGKDASAKSSLENVRAAAEIYAGTNSGFYGYASDNTSTAGVCGDAEVIKLMEAAKAQTLNDYACLHNATALKQATEYKVAIQLLSTEYFCVDSTGAAILTATDETGTNTTCLP